MSNWILFSQNNWHNGGNSTEQYARTLKEKCLYIQGTASRAEGEEDGVRFGPQLEKFWVPNVTRDTIAMFCKPTFKAYQYMRMIKDIGGKVIYRAVDDWELWKGNEWYDQAIEKAMIELADVAVSTSIRVAMKYGIKRLPNACYYVSSIPTITRSIKKVGFIGDVDNQVSSARFDMNIVIYLAERFPRLNFVLCGSRVSWELPSNIQVLPYCKWKEANRQLENIDVGFIPYYGEEMSGVQPLKSWEYLGYGLPQLAPEGLDLPDHSSVSTYRSYEECGDKLEVILNTSYCWDSIIEFAKQNTWRKRLEQLERMLGL